MINRIIPTAFFPQKNLTSKVFYVGFPEYLKNELFKIEELRDNYPNLHTDPLKHLILSWLPGVVDCNKISRNGDSSKWLISCEPVDLDLLSEAVKVWIHSKYLTNKKITPELKEIARGLYESVNPDIFKGKAEAKTLIDTDGNVKCGEAFSVIPLIIVEKLKGKDLKLEGKKAKLFYAGKNLLVTDPSALYDERRKQYFSICIEFSLQTIPFLKKPIVVYHLKVRRWVSASATQAGYKVNNNNTTAYIRTGKNILQPIKFRYEKDAKELRWNNLEKKCYEYYSLDNSLPDLKDLVEKPDEYISNRPGSVVITYRYALNIKKHAVKPGLPMIDRINIYNWLVDSLSNSVIQTSGAARFSKHMSGLDKSDIQNLDKNTFLARLAQAIGSNELSIEIYDCTSDGIGVQVKEAIKSHFGMTSGVLESSELNVTISTKLLGSLANPLDVSMGKIERVEQRMNEVVEKFGQAKVRGTACIVVLPYKKEDGKNCYEKDEDPKGALRAGFAKTGRLTQFLTPSSEDNSTNVNNRVQSAVYDLYRQLGYLQPLKEKKGKGISYDNPIMGLWVINSKRTIYGKTKPFPVFVTVAYSKGEVWVECEYLFEGRIRYWEACLEFQKVSGNDRIRHIEYKDACATIRRKIIELYHTQKDPFLILVNNNDISRKIWRFITDKNLTNMNREDEYNLDRIWFESEKANDGLQLNGKENKLRIIRIRGNEEVPDYVYDINDEEDIRSVSGVFCFFEDKVFWGIAPRPDDQLFKNAYKKFSKLQYPVREAKLPDMIEIIPMHLKPEDDPQEWVWLVQSLRKNPHQYINTLKLPLPLHFALKLEEYIG